MNSRIFNLSEIELEISEIKPVLKCIINTIHFNRNTKKLVVPRVVQCYEFNNLEYVMIDNITLENQVNEKIDNIYNKLLDECKINIAIILYDKKITKGWFGNNEELLEWEKWILPVRLIKNQSKSYQYLREKNIKHILSTIFIAIDNNPTIPDCKGEFYSFDIIDNNMKSMFSKFLDTIKNGPPDLISNITKF